MDFPGGNLELLGWLVAVCGLSAILLISVTVLTVTVRARRRRKATRAVRGVSLAVGSDLIQPDELQRYGDYLRANVEWPDECPHGHEGAA